MDLAKSEGLAKLAKDAAAVQNVSAGEAMEGIVLAIEPTITSGEHDAAHPVGSPFLDLRVESPSVRRTP